MRPRMKKQAYDQAISTMKNIQTETDTNKKPLLIATITLDSFSRQHFFRKLPRTLNYLNELELSEKYKIFDFKFHNIIGAATFENQAAFLGNNSIPHYPPADSRLGRHSL